MNAVAQQPAMERIESAAAFYSAARETLRTIMLQVEAERRDVLERHRPKLLAAIDEASLARQALTSLVDDHRKLFDKPRTRRLHGVTVGLRKQPGKVKFADEQQAIALIRQKLAAKADVLIVRKESIVADAARELPASELAAIGGSITDADDQIVVKASDDDIDKLVKAFASADDELDREF